MKFTKMQGLGNDYLYVYGEAPANISELSRKLSERHFGAGADGMIYISKSTAAAVSYTHLTPISHRRRKRFKKKRRNVSTRYICTMCFVPIGVFP